MTVCQMAPVRYMVSTTTLESMGKSRVHLGLFSRRSESRDRLGA